MDTFDVSTETDENIATLTLHYNILPSDIFLLVIKCVGITKRLFQTREGWVSDASRFLCDITLWSRGLCVE